MAVAILAAVGLLVSVSAITTTQGAADTTRAAGPVSRAEVPTRVDALPEVQARQAPGSAADRSAPETEVSRPDVRYRSAEIPGRKKSGPRAVRIKVPAVGIDSRVRPVGVARDRQMALPLDPRVMGWYRFGPSPGAGRGSVIVAGHLDSRRFGLGPLVRLRQVEVGDRVRVTLADGSRRLYVVRSVRRFDRQALPAELFSRVGRERLRIVTCGGAFLPDRGGYQKNLVVTAVPA